MKKGDVAVTLGSLFEPYPQGLVIGTVVRGVGRAARSRGNAELRPIVDLDALNLVKVLEVRAGDHSVIRRIRLGFVVLVRVVLQTTLFTHLRIDDVAPEVGLVAVLAVAYEDGPDSGALFGFIMGLAIDLFLTTPFGLSALAYAVTGYAVGVFQAGVVRTTPWLAPILGGVGGLFGGLVFITAGAIVGQSGYLSLESLRIVLISATFDAMIAPLVFPIVRRVARRARTPARPGGSEGDASGVRPSARLGPGDRPMNEPNSRRRLAVGRGDRGGLVRRAPHPVSGSCRSPGARSWPWPRSASATASCRCRPCAGRSTTANGIVLARDRAGHVAHRQSSAAVEHRAHDARDQPRQPVAQDARRRRQADRQHQLRRRSSRSRWRRTSTRRRRSTSPSTATDFPECRVDPTTERRYPQDFQAADIVGYLGQINADELKSTRRRVRVDRHHREDRCRGDVRVRAARQAGRGQGARSTTRAASSTWSQ